MFLGLATSGVISCMGAYVTALLPKASLFGAVQTISGSAVVVILALSLIATNVLTTYTGMLSLTSALSTFKEVPISKMVRVAGIVITAGAGLIAAALGYRSFLNSFENFLYVLLFVFIPWSAVNLFDFYFVKKGSYNIRAFFDRNGEVSAGPRRYRSRCISSDWESSFLFINQTFYVGPLVSALGGVDISWIVGFVVPFGLYYIVATLWPQVAGVNVAVEHGRLDVSVEADFLANPAGSVAGVADAVAGEAPTT